MAAEWPEIDPRQETKSGTEQVNQKTKNQQPTQMTNPNLTPNLREPDHPPTKNADADTLERLRNGDQRAFEQIYLNFMPGVRNFLVKFTRSKEAGREIAQEVFVKLWDRREHIDPTRNISGYLFTIARNFALKYLIGMAHKADQDPSTLNLKEDSPGADEQYAAHEMEILIAVAVSKMPPQRRKIYEMSRLEQLSNSEISELLKISKNTVENHLTSALNDLRKTCAEYAFLLLLLCV